MPKRFTLHSNSSTTSQSRAGSPGNSKGRSFFGISLGKHDSTDSTDHIYSPAVTHSDNDQQSINQHLHNNEKNNSPLPSKNSSLLDLNHNNNNHHHSMLELKRFFRPSVKKHASPTTSSKSSIDASASTFSLSKPTEPLSQDGVLVQKYGKLGKILGSGAGGSVRLLTRPSDGVTFAVKEFRPRKPNEQMKDYAKKCTAEFCIGSTLHHPNIIQTLDIAHENGHYFEVMEYCPIDFFAVVMSGKMTRGEINCCLRQITEGVKYLHEMGLAHRDLKLDNCVVTDNGILKLIDFGSAVVFRYPFEDHIVKAHGVVGSDPYLAPEVLTKKEYDPQPVDIWSIAIIYCCMTLKRFPWKAPKQSDPSYKLYCMPDDMPHDYALSAKQHKELLARKREERLRRENDEAETGTSGVEKITEVLNDTSIQSEGKRETTNSTEKSIHSERELIHNKNDKHPVPPGEQKPHHRTIHGPYRLMRLLPHASRPIISKMLTVDPNNRATLDDVFQDEWFSSIIPCTINKKGETVHAPGHHHTFVKGEEAHLQSYKDSKKH